MKRRHEVQLFLAIAAVFVGLAGSATWQQERFVLDELHRHLAAVPRLANVAFLEAGLRGDAFSMLEVTRQTLGLKLDEKTFETIDETDATVQLMRDVAVSELVEKDRKEIQDAMDALLDFEKRKVKETFDKVTGSKLEDELKGRVQAVKDIRKIMEWIVENDHRLREMQGIIKMLYQYFWHYEDVFNRTDVDDNFRYITVMEQLNSHVRVLFDRDIMSSTLATLVKDTKAAFAGFQMKKLSTGPLLEAIASIKADAAKIDSLKSLSATIDKLKVSLKNLEVFRDTATPDEIAKLRAVMRSSKSSFFDDYTTGTLLAALPDGLQDVKTCAREMPRGFVSRMVGAIDDETTTSIYRPTMTFLEWAEKAGREMEEIHEMVNGLESSEWDEFTTLVAELKTSLKAGSLRDEFQKLQGCLKEFKGFEDVSKEEKVLEVLHATIDKTDVVRGELKKVDAMFKEVEKLTSPQFRIDMEPIQLETKNTTIDNMNFEAIRANLTTILPYHDVFVRVFHHFQNFRENQSFETAWENFNKSMLKIDFPATTRAFKDLSAKLDKTGVAKTLKCFTADVSKTVPEMKTLVETTTKVWDGEKMRQLESVAHVKNALRRAREQVGHVDKVDKSVGVKTPINMKEEELKALVDGFKSLGEFVKVQDVLKLLETFGTSEAIFEGVQDAGEKEQLSKAWDALLAAISSFLQSFSASLLEFGPGSEYESVLDGVAKTAAVPEFQAEIEKLKPFFGADEYAGILQEEILESLDTLEHFQTEFEEHKTRLTGMSQGLKATNKWLTDIVGEPRARSKAECECLEMIGSEDPCQSLCSSTSSPKSLPEPDGDANDEGTADVSDVAATTPES